MAEVDRYVVVPKEGSDKTILGGPYLWDGEAEWQPPEDGKAIKESEALANGYSYPTPPDEE